MEAGVRACNYSRKQKSLGLLCSNFIGLYNRDGVDSVGLDDAAARLGVERRRIYDIVNVLESVGVLSRKGKNQYSWIGFSGIPKALKDLNEEALKEISGDPTPNPSPLVDYSDDEEDDSLSHQTTEVDGDQGSPNSHAPEGSAPWKVRSVMGSRREKSLGLLTRKFVKLFLTTKADTISLDEAAKLLLGAGDSYQMRSNAAKVRRLYDIANILSSMNLIKKTQQADSRKPAFRWVGLHGEPQNDATIAAVPPMKQWNKRVFGSDITNTDFKRRKAMASAQTRSDIIKQCNLTAQKQLQCSRGHVFGPFHPAGMAKGDKDTEVTQEKKDDDWETLAASFRHQYHNQALSELFAHYLEAWKSWFLRSLKEVMPSNLASRSTTGESRSTFFSYLTDIQFK